MITNVALIALNNPMSCAGNNYSQILRKYQNLSNNPTCVYDQFYGICDDNMGIITVLIIIKKSSKSALSLGLVNFKSPVPKRLRNMIDVRHGFKTCAYYTNNDIEDVINHICLN